MTAEKIYEIHYKLHGQSKSFMMRAEEMNNANAWHWASCDAGVGIIPKSSRDIARRISKPFAERYGVTDVCWQVSAPLKWEDD